MHSRPSAFDRYFVGPRLRRLSPELASQYLDRAAPYATLLAAMNRQTGPMERAKVMAIRASGHISKLERRRDVLEAGAKRGYEAIVAAFGRV
jgi:hypothetical protein